MSFSAITDAPTAPDPNDSPELFNSRAFALMAWLVTLPGMLNTLSDEYADWIGASLIGTSTTSVAIGAGTKNFTTQPGLAYGIGQWLIAASGADPSNYVLGQVTSYNSSTGAVALSVLSTGVGGSGTFADWTLAPVPAPISRVRSNAATSFSSPLSFNSDLYDTYSASAQAGNLTIPVDAGTPVNGRKMTFELTCDATPRTITFTGGASKGFKPVGAGLIVSGSDYTLTLTASKTTIVACIYSSAKARWQVVGIAQES